MINNKILISIIVVVVLGVGGYFFMNAQKGSFQQDHNMEDTSGKSAAQSHRSYEIKVTSQPTSVEPKKPVTLRYKIKNDKGQVLKNYDVVHEKIMHFITVRKDLAHFQHLHPKYNEQTGEFTLDITFPEDGPYRMFPDFTPGVDNPDKQPVTLSTDVEVGDSNKYYAQSVVPDTESNKTYGDYAVAFDFPKDIQKEKEVTFGVSISKNGKPVTNLENYLGALGHSVILKEGTLDFIHTHALSPTAQNNTAGGHSMQGSQNNTAERGPKIEFSTTFPKEGVYKIFTQFQHEGNLQTVSYNVKVNN